MVHKNRIFTSGEIQITEQVLKVRPKKVTVTPFSNNPIHHFLLLRCVHCERKKTYTIIASDFEELKFTGKENGAMTLKEEKRGGGVLPSKNFFFLYENKRFLLSSAQQWGCWNWLFPQNWLAPKSSSGVKITLFLSNYISSEYVLCSPDVSQSGEGADFPLCPPCSTPEWSNFQIQSREPHSQIPSHKPLDTFGRKGSGKIKTMFPSSPWAIPHPATSGCP